MVERAEFLFAGTCLVGKLMEFCLGLVPRCLPLLDLPSRCSAFLELADEHFAALEE